MSQLGEAWNWKVEKLTIDEAEEEENEGVSPGEHQLSERDPEEELESDVSPEEALVGHSGDLDGELGEGRGRRRGRGSEVVLLSSFDVEPGDGRATAMSLDEGSSDVDEGEESEETGDSPPQVDREVVLPGSAKKGGEKKRANQSDSKSDGCKARER